MLNQNPKELHWFWQITTKWYFFPLLYVLMVLLLTIGEVWTLVLSDERYVINFTSFSGQFFYIFISFFPFGLLWFLQLFGLGLHFEIVGLGQSVSPFAKYYYTATYLIPFISMFLIVYFKRKKNIVLKWLVISLLLFMFISFVGCSSKAFIGPTISSVG